ncbi:hypothetical protein QE394_001099 [Arthrobacter sp. SORGH_AS 212]|uniref:DUF7426 family protein n=1 Tax=Pseudarthrobacter sp. SORGH_AS 212 TaxID=3041777 RepID=UPI002785865A|nr:hypothetical protein [Arthrobacter sp. SORGH_AS_0212]
MTETLEQLGTFLDPILGVPFRGKTYKVPPVDAETGLKLQRLISAGVQAAVEKKLDPETIELVSDAEEKGFYQTVLGPVYDELLADGATFHALKFIGQTALMWHAQDFDTAEEFWMAEGKAPTPNRAERRTATRTGTAAATTTRKRASVTGTTTPKGTRSRAASGRKS